MSHFDNSDSHYKSAVKELAGDLSKSDPGSLDAAKHLILKELYDPKHSPLDVVKFLNDANSKTTLHHGGDQESSQIDTSNNEIKIVTNGGWEGRHETKVAPLPVIEFDKN